VSFLRSSLDAYGIAVYVGERGVSSMQIAYIKFNNREDQVRGFYELATKAQVTSLPGGVYAVPWKALSLLDEENISYRIEVV
jgi:hypothetical protein